MADLKQRVELLKDLRIKGVPSYIASQMDSRLQAWCDSQKAAKSELQKLKARIHQIKMSLAKKTQTKIDLHRALESGRAEIARLKEQLAKAEDAQEILESDLAEVKQVEANIFQQLDLQDKILADKEQEAAKLQSTYEETFKATLVAEFEQAYKAELLNLEEQIRHYKLV